MDAKVASVEFALIAIGMTPEERKRLIAEVETTVDDLHKRKAVIDFLKMLDAKVGKN